MDYDKLIYCRYDINGLKIIEKILKFNSYKQNSTNLYPLLKYISCIMVNWFTLVMTLMYSK